MEEHIFDLKNENLSLKKQLNNMEELYKKKIQLREDEIESLKESILEVEKSNNEIRLKERDLFNTKRMQLEEIKSLKHQVSLELNF
ncbi:hypothetical protein QR98_0095810 [Sarcoptes scabiei]|uniref:Uncharacterized protein n=1 Tax=Sarcoptes scabiei TaxID=52283 RepID=A0A132AKB9_SARSC|nr:hypothetical protein QR98_0095810 [Sarcoptes scabiei]